MPREEPASVAKTTESGTGVSCRDRYIGITTTKYSVEPWPVADLSPSPDHSLSLSGTMFCYRCSYAVKKSAHFGSIVADSVAIRNALFW